MTDNTNLYIVQRKHPQISDGRGVGYGKVGVQNTKAVVQCVSETGQDIANITIDCLYKVVYEDRFSPKCVTLNDL